MFDTQNGELSTASTMARIFHLQKKDDEQSSDEDDDSTPTNYYGFPSPNCPPYITELAGFESDLWSLVD